MAKQLRFLHILTTLTSLFLSPVFFGHFSYTAAGIIVKRQAQQNEWMTKCKIHEGKVACDTEMSATDLSFLCPCDSELKALKMEVETLQGQVAKLLKSTEGGGDTEEPKTTENNGGQSGSGGEKGGTDDGTGETHSNPDTNKMDNAKQNTELGGRCSASSECQSGLACDPTRRECRRTINGECASNHDCLSDTTCDMDTHECRYGLDSQCSLALEQCISHAACDSRTGTCKGHLGSSCNVDGDCANEYICDPASGTCKQAPGGRCKDEMECMSGGSCEKNICRMKFDNHCETDSDCQDGYVCDLQISLCKYGVGHPCSTSQRSVCESRAICDSFTGKCLVPLGRSCNSEEECVRDTVCDEDKRVCSVPIGGSCRGAASSPNVCVTGSDCDVTSQVCRTVPGVQCIENSECGPGSVCDTGRRVCVRLCSDNNHCERHQVCDQVSKECRTALGGECSSSLDCSGQAGCFPDSNGLEYRCLLPVGEQCTDSSECVWNSKCDIGLGQKTCRGMVNYTCLSSNDCAGDLECDTKILINKCKTSRGDRCETNFDCITGTACFKNEFRESTCEIGFNASCQDFTDCTRPMICDASTATCKLNIKAKCNSTSQCITGYVCADGEKECIRPLNGQCRQDFECIRGTVCMVKQGLGYCKAQMGTGCSADSDCDDLNKLSCDPMTKTCKRAQDGPCSTNSDCKTGLRCREDRCKIGCSGWLDGMVYRGHCYRLLQIPREQADAQRACVELDGYLVAMETLEEESFIRAMLMQQDDKPSSLWMALYFSEQDGWAWWYPDKGMDTRRLSFRPTWYDDHPVNPAQKNCGFIETETYAWVNGECEETKPGFICEKNDEIA